MNNKHHAAAPRSHAASRSLLMLLLLVVGSASAAPAQDAPAPAVTEPYAYTATNPVSRGALFNLRAVRGHFVTVAFPDAWLDQAQGGLSDNFHATLFRAAINRNTREVIGCWQETAGIRLFLNPTSDLHSIATHLAVNPMLNGSRTPFPHTQKFTPQNYKPLLSLNLLKTINVQGPWRFIFNKIRESFATDGRFA